MAVFQGKLKQFVCWGVLLSPLVSGTGLASPGYGAGTFTIKPINVNVGNFFPGFRSKDSKFNTTGFVGPNLIAISVAKNVYRSPLDFGFSESDRNGVGYGAEFGYLLIDNLELFSRIGYCRERPTGQSVSGNLSLKFKPRDNYGFGIGLRQYFKSDSAWKFFAGFGAGITYQDETKSDVYAHNRVAGVEPLNDLFISTYKLGKSVYLPNFEVFVGTDYQINANMAFSFSAGIRYTKRGKGSTIVTPAVIAPYPIPLPVPSTALQYRDGYSRWNFPLTVSFKVMI